jgi:hypothetical protein
MDAAIVRSTVRVSLVEDIEWRFMRDCPLDEIANVQMRPAQARAFGGAAEDLIA